MRFSYRHLAKPVLLVLVLWANSLWAETIAGKVIKIADGDTLTILDKGRHTGSGSQP